MPPPADKNLIVLLEDLRRPEWLVDTVLPAIIFASSFLFGGPFWPVAFLLQGLACLQTFMVVYTLLFRPVRRVAFDQMRNELVLADGFQLRPGVEHRVKVADIARVYAVELKCQHTGNQKWRLRADTKSGGVIALGFTSLRDPAEIARLIGKFDVVLGTSTQMAAVAVKPRAERRARIVGPADDPFHPQSLDEAAGRMAEAITSTARTMRPARQSRLARAV